jgi:1-acyl-sn-glycerol-3-phosphate acyltransferase
MVVNHVTNWDPLLVACAFPEQMYFVGSENIFRMGVAGRLIRLLFDPIPRLKGRIASDTALAILRRLKRGASVCLFAEGDRCWNGLTGSIHATTGRLVRAGGATLVTFRLQGGYLTSPRWAKSLRCGGMNGRVVGVYPPEKLRAMSPERINALIERDLCEDAWARQREEPAAYRGKNPAEYLERLFCLCPFCLRVDTLRSEDDRFRCDCGFAARYTEYGFLEGETLPYDNIPDWLRWQDAALCALWETDAAGSIFTDTEIRVTEVLPGHRQRKMGTGSLSLFRDRIAWNGMEFSIMDVTGVSLVTGQTLELGVGREHFEFSSGRVRCLRKYMTLIEYVIKRRSPQPVTAAAASDG